MCCCFQRKNMDRSLHKGNVWGKIAVKKDVHKDWSLQVIFKDDLTSIQDGFVFVLLIVTHKFRKCKFNFYMHAFKNYEWIRLSARLFCSHFGRQGYAIPATYENHWLIYFLIFLWRGKKSLKFNELGGNTDNARNALIFHKIW